MAQYCVSALIDKIHQISTSIAPSDEGHGSSTERERERNQQLHRLRLTLISTLSALPLSLLPGVLHEIRTMLVGMGDEPREAVDGRADEEDSDKDELVQALYREILEGVGDREKEFMIRWWVEMKDGLGAVFVLAPDDVVEKALGKGKGKADESEDEQAVVASRL